MTTPVRLGLIGTGLAVELLHWPALRTLGDRFQVTAFCDRSRDQAERFAAYSGTDMARYHADHHDLLARDDVDAVLVTVPIPALYSVTKSALDAGKHVLCEKPTGADEEQARAFLALPTAYPDQTILIGENIFYRDDLRLARSWLDDGVIGTPHLMAWRVAVHLVPRDGSFTGTPWRQRPRYRGAVHLDAGVHNIAQIRLLCGEIVAVHGGVRTANSTLDGPSDLVLNLEFANGAIGNFTACYADVPVPAEPNEMRVYGSEGVLVLGGTRTARRVTLARKDGTTRVEEFRGIDNGYHAELRNFYDAVTYGEPVVGTIWQSYLNMLVVLRALDSAQQRAVLAVDEPRPPAEPVGVPLWRPRGGTGLFDGLPGEHVVVAD